LSDSGNVYVWGNNKSGQLGLPASDTVPPTKLALNEKIVALSAGRNHSLFLTENGKKYVTGDNTSQPFGPLDKGNTNMKSLYVTDSIPPEKPEFFIQLSSGYSMSAAIDDKKRAYVWGSSWNGCLGHKSVTDIAEPTALEFFDQNCAQIDTVFGVTTILLENGDIYNCGNNQNYRLGLGHALNMWEPVKVELPSPAFRFYSGTNATIAQTVDGNWFAWGDNEFGSLLTGDQAVYSKPVKIDLPFSVESISSHMARSLLLNTNGIVYQWGSPTDTENLKLGFQEVDIPEKITGIATSSYGCYALSEDGNVYAWGDNTSGALGLAQKKLYTTPSIVPLKAKIAEIAVSPVFGVVMALSTRGEVYTWGYDVLRKGTDEILTKPTLVSLPEKISRVVAGDVTVYAISQSGNIYTWGGVINNAQWQPQRTPILMPFKCALEGPYFYGWDEEEMRYIPYENPNYPGWQLCSAKSFDWQNYLCSFKFICQWCFRQRFAI